MKARLYSKTSKAPKAALSGQAAIVWAALSATPELATVVNERIATSATPLVTRQDPFRVTLYYILVFKSRGLVAAHEPIVAVETDPIEDVLGDVIDATDDELEMLTAPDAE